MEAVLKLRDRVGIAIDQLRKLIIRNFPEIDMDLAWIKRGWQLIWEQRELLKECDQLERLQLRYNNQPTNSGGNAFNLYPSASHNNSNGYQQPDDRQSKVWQNKVAPRLQIYGQSDFDNCDYQMNGPQPLMTLGNVGNLNRLPGPQRRPRFAYATKPIGVKEKIKFVQGRVKKLKVVVNPQNKSKFPKKVGPGYARPVSEGHIGVHRPRKVTPVVHDNTYQVTRKMPNPKLHSRLELCLGKILRQVEESVKKSGLEIEFTEPLVTTIKENISNQIHETMVGKHARSIRHVLKLYRMRHPCTEDVLFVRHLKNTLQKEAAAKMDDVMFVENLWNTHRKEAAAKVGVDTIPILTSKSLTKDNVNRKPGDAADKTGGNAESNLQDEEKKEWTFQKVYTQIVQLNKLLHQLTDYLHAETKENGPEKLNMEESQTGGKNKKTEGEEEGVESASPKDRKMDKLEQLIEQKLPFIPPRFKNLMLTILNDEPIPRHDTDARKNKLYRAKFIGRPTLPNRLSLSHFLMGYNVQSIKKYKNWAHILIIGCGTEEDRDRLVATSGSIIENIRLHITTYQDTRPTSNHTSSSAAMPATHVEEAGNNIKHTVDLGNCKVGEDQNAHVENVVMDLDSQDNVGKAESMVAETGNLGEKIKKKPFDKSPKPKRHSCRLKKRYFQI